MQYIVNEITFNMIFVPLSKQRLKIEDYTAIMTHYSQIMARTFSKWQYLRLEDIHTILGTEQFKIQV